jgi:hypothetical protein
VLAVDVFAAKWYLRINPDGSGKFGYQYENNYIDFGPGTFDIGYLERSLLAEASSNVSGGSDATVSLQLEDVAPRPMSVRLSFAMDLFSRARDACRSDPMFPTLDSDWVRTPPK